MGDLGRGPGEPKTTGITLPTVFWDTLYLLWLWAQPVEVLCACLFLRHQDRAPHESRMAGSPVRYDVSSALSECGL